MIKTVNLQKIFKTEEVETWALNNVNLEIKAGEFVAIMGPSGCGKSTLLNILGLLDNPTGGTYELNGTDVSKFTEAQRTNLRKGVIGFVFQSFNLIDELNVFENIELPLLYMGIPAAERKRRVEDAMNRMAIAHRVKHFPQQLSGGQQQRVAIARAVVANPKLILANTIKGKGISFMENTKKAFVCVSFLPMKRGNMATGSALSRRYKKQVLYSRQERKTLRHQEKLLVSKSDARF